MSGDIFVTAEKVRLAFKCVGASDIAEHPIIYRITP